MVLYHARKNQSTLFFPSLVRSYRRHATDDRRMNVRPQLLDRVPRLLRDTPFRRYWTGQSLSLLGDQIGGLALPLTAVLVLHADSQAMGLLTAVGRMPGLLFSIHAGAWVDRHGRRRLIMMIADIARAALLAAIPAAYFLGWLSLPWLLVIWFLTGFCSVLFQVSSSTLFVSLVPRERYVEANSLLQGSNALAWLTGPGIGGFLAEALSAPMAVLADALSFVASAVSLARIHPEEPPPARAERGHATAGLRFVWSSPVLRASLAAMVTINLFRAVYFALYVLYASDSLHVSPAELGIILGPSSVGAIFGSAAAGRVSRRIGLGRAFLVGTVLSTVPLVLVPLAQGPHLTVVALLFLAEGFSGMGFMVQEISNGAILAAAIPDALRARVGGAMGFVRSWAGPIGALLGGVLPTLIGLRPTLFVATVGATLGCLWLLPSPIIRLRSVADFVSKA